MSDTTFDEPLVPAKPAVGKRVDPKAPSEKKKGMARVLDAVERVGNKVPHPAIIFVALIALIAVLSHVLYLLGVSVSYEAINPETHAVEATTTAVQSLLSTEGIRFMFEGVVANLMDFNAVGVIIVAMIGVGVADAAGLVGALIHKLVLVAPKKAITYILVFIGILSSIAADAGYLVLIPLAAAAFMRLGRHPLAGLAASFAAVAAVFSVNVLIKPLDGIRTEITNDAIQIMSPGVTIDLPANLWFSIASVLLLTVLVSIVTEKI